MVSHIVMKTLSVRTVLLGALLLAVAGCASSPYERGNNPQGLSQREFLLQPKHALSVRLQSPKSERPRSALHGISSINAMQDTCLAA